MNAENEALVEKFNLNPVGVEVRYWPVLPTGLLAPMKKGRTDLFSSRITHTMSKAYTDWNGEPVVFINGQEGCVSLRHVELENEL